MNRNKAVGVRVVRWGRLDKRDARHVPVVGTMGGGGVSRLRLCVSMETLRRRGRSDSSILRF